MKQGRDTTQEERIQIVKECLASGKNYGEMALKYKVSYQQVRTWTLRFEEMGEAGLEDRRGKRKKNQTPRTELEKAQIEIEQLKHKLYLAEMERDLLKKLDEIERRDALDVPGRQRILSILLRIFWIGSSMLQSPTRSGLPM